MSLADAQAGFLQRLLGPGEAVSPGLDVYRRTLRANRHGALRGAFPVVARLVGDAFFAEAAERYADQSPSTSGDLHEYGAAFATFLSVYDHAASLPYLPDVARLEWAVHRCAFAADPAPFDFAALARVPSGELDAVRLVPQPGAALLLSSHPVVSIWEANQGGRDGELSAEWRAERAVVFRRGPAVAVERAGDEAAMLASLLDGHPLGDACARPSDATSLAGWVEAGLFLGIAS